MIGRHRVSCGVGCVVDVWREDGALVVSAQHVPTCRVDRDTQAYLEWRAELRSLLAVLKDMRGTTDPEKSR